MPIYSVGRNSDCLCGSGKKYKYCCLPLIGKHKDYSLATRIEFNKGNYEEALKLCRADLTNYLINVKSHTELLLITKSYFGQELLSIDIKALSEIIDMLMIIIKCGNLEVDFQNTLKRLKKIFYNERWHFRLNYYKAAWEYFIRDDRVSAKAILKTINYNEIMDLDFLEMYYDLFADELSFSQNIKFLEKLISKENKCPSIIHYKGILALTYFLLGDAAKARDILLESIRIAEKNLTQFTDFYGYYQLARVYWFAGKLSKSATLLNKSIEYFQKSSKVDSLTQSGYAMIFSHIGDVYFDLQEYDQALENYFKSQKYIDMPLTNILIAQVYLEMKDFTNADKYLSKVIYESLTEDNKIDYLFNLCRFVIIKKNNKQAEFIYNELNKLELHDKYFSDRRYELMNNLLEIYKDFSSEELIEKSKAKSLLNIISECIMLRPNFMGVGIDINSIIKNIINKDKK